MAYDAQKDLFPFIGTDEDTDIILFFTDDKNEPRKINIRRCIEGDTGFTGNAMGYTGETMEDFMTACPKTPQVPIQFSWNKNPDFESNFQETNGIQFVYQNVYIDGFVTAISPMSEVAFPTAIQNLGSSSLANVTVESECILQIPKQGPEIASIRILFREGNDGTFKMIDEISNVEDVSNDLFDFDNTDGVLGYYIFRNDSVYPIIPVNQTEKNYDNLPRRARAQSVSGNRLMYGNYLEGYNPIQTSAVGKAILRFVDQNAATVDAQIVPGNYMADNQRVSAPRGQSVGFSINVGTAPIKPGGYKLAVELVPERNFHIYNQNTSYSPSRNMTFNNSLEYNFDGTAASDSAGAPTEEDNFLGGDKIWQIALRSEGTMIEATDSPNNTIMLYGYQNSDTTVGTVSGVGSFPWSVLNGTVNQTVGTTPANPVIFPSAPVSVKIVVEVTTEIQPTDFLLALEKLIEVGQTQNPYVISIDYSGLEIEVDPDPFTQNDLNRALGVRSIVNTGVGLESGDSFTYNSNFTDNVCWVPIDNYSTASNFEEYRDYPGGFYMIKNADLLLNVRKVGNLMAQPETGANSPLFGENNTNPSTATVSFFRFEVVAAANVETLTCLPEPIQGLGYADESGTEYTTSSHLPWRLPDGDPGIGLSTNVKYQWPLVLGQASQEGSEPLFPGITILGNADVSDGEAFGGNGRVFIEPTIGFPVPQQTGQVYKFVNPFGKVFRAVITAFDTPGLGTKRITIDNNTFQTTETSDFAGPFTFYRDLGGEGLADIPNPNFPRGIAVKNKDGDYLNFNHYGISGQIGPIAIGKWHVFSPEDISNGNWQDNFEYDWVNADGESVTTKPTNTNNWLEPVSSLWLGSLQFPNGRMTLIESSQAPGGQFISLVDGAVGVGSFEGGENGLSKVSDNEFFYAIAPGDYSGSQSATTDSSQANTGEATPVSNRRGTVWNTTLIGLHTNFKYLHGDFGKDQGNIVYEADDILNGYRHPSSPVEADYQAAPFQDLGSFLDVGQEGLSISSFKTRDFHDFGIVYFDKRGRAGTVNPLPSVYVPGYSPEERTSDEKGQVVIQYTLNHLPPSWADSYKIVYAGSANTERFIQYTAGGAYVEPNVIGVGNDKIYVSLNYLQSNRASYVRSYGASDQDTGEPTLYRFTPGDKLRVISYYENDDTIVYVPKGTDFDVVGVEEISIESENPLIDETLGSEPGDLVQRSGSFVLLRNNVQASGFRAADIAAGSDFWGHRCVFEIVTQRKSRGEELKPYYETPFGGKIIVENGQKVHQYGVINIDEGDVYYRKVPVNMRPYDDGAEEFTDLINADENNNETSQSRFKSYYLETDAVTDLYRSNAKNYGKPHFVIDGYRERLNDSSIIYSKPTNQESFNIFYTSFSPLEKNYFDMPAKYGDIDYLADNGDSLYVAQNSKIGKLQVDKSLTTSGAGSDTLNLSRDVLSSPRFFLEDVGTDGHPESVTWENATMYFVDQSKGIVASAGERGMTFISSAGMDKFFKRILNVYSSNARITTGYNPFTDELLVSMMPNSQVNNLIPTGEKHMSNIDNQKTFAYDLAGKSWVTAYSFYSPNYANIGNSLISFKDVFRRGGKDLVFVHDKGNKNTFYNTSYDSLFRSVAVDNANLTKDYKSISIDGSSPWQLRLNTTDEFASIKNLKDYEGTFYSDIPRSEVTSKSKNHLKAVGKIVSVSQIDANTFEFEFSTDISQYHITLSNPRQSGTQNAVSECLFYSTQFAAGPASGFSIVSRPTKITGTNKLTVTTDLVLSDAAAASFINFVTDKVLIVKSVSKLFGDPLRDKFLEITAITSPDREKKKELYSINIDYIESNLNSSR